MSSNNNSNTSNINTTTSGGGGGGPGEMVVLVNGKATLVAGQFEPILNTKLQGLWQLRQTIRGDGTMFEFDNAANLETGSAAATAAVVVAYNVKLANMMLQGNFKGLVAEVDLTISEQAGNNNNNKFGGSESVSNSTGISIDDIIEYTRKILTTTGLVKNPIGITLPVTTTTTATTTGVTEFNPKNIVFGPKLKAAAATSTNKTMTNITDFSRLDTVRQYIEIIS